MCLVLMPYGPIETPSIAIGLLKSVLAAANVRVAVHHGNIPRKALAGAFARRLQRDIPESVLEPAVGRLGELGLLLTLGDRLLSLVLNVESSPLPGQETYPAGSVHAEPPAPPKRQAVDA